MFSIVNANVHHLLHERVATVQFPTLDFETIASFFKNGFFFASIFGGASKYGTAGLIPSIYVVTLQKQPPKPRKPESMYPTGFAGRDNNLTCG